MTLLIPLIVLLSKIEINLPTISWALISLEHPSDELSQEECLNLHSKAEVDSETEDFEEALEEVLEEALEVALEEDWFE